MSDRIHPVGFWNIQNNYNGKSNTTVWHSSSRCVSEIQNNNHSAQSNTTGWQNSSHCVSKHSKQQSHCSVQQNSATEFIPLCFETFKTTITMLSPTQLGGRIHPIVFQNIQNNNHNAQSNTTVWHNSSHYVSKHSKQQSQCSVQHNSVIEYNPLRFEPLWSPCSVSNNPS